jgi:hypothetical protein
MARGNCCRLIFIHKTASTASIFYFFFQIAHGPSRFRLKSEVSPSPFVWIAESFITRAAASVAEQNVVIVPFICLNRETEVLILTAMLAILALSLTRNSSSSVFEKLKLHLVECILSVDGSNRQPQELCVT